MRELPTLAVVGATGAVGAVLLELLTSRKNVWGEIRLVASPRSVGRRLHVRGERLEVCALTPEVFDGVDVAMFDVPDDVSAVWAPFAAAMGAVVIDNSGVFRMDPDVPLVVPEINPAQVGIRPKGIIANATCTTLAMIVALGPLHEEYALRELTASSYQAASGAGQLGVEVLHDQLVKLAGDRSIGILPGDIRRTVGDDLGPFPAPLGFNVIPWVGSVVDGDWSSEELTIRDESRRILGLPDLKVSVTCVQVPVVTGHSIAVHAIFGAEVETTRAREVLEAAPGVVVVDDSVAAEFPTPADAAGTDPTWVGRIRRSLDDPRALEMFVVGDNLRKGAALNMTQIAELVAAEF